VRPVTTRVPALAEPTLTSSARCPLVHVDQRGGVGAALYVLVRAGQLAALRGEARWGVSSGVSCGEDRIEHHPTDRVGARSDLPTSRSGSAMPRRRIVTCGARCSPPSARPLPLDHLSGRGRVAVGQGAEKVEVGGAWLGFWNGHLG